MASASYESIMALATVSTSKNGVTPSSSCCVAAIRAHKPMTSKLRSAYRKNGAKKMAKKLTTYDPAEDLGSDEAIAIFMAEAFQTNDVRYISHALGVVARA